MENNIGVGTIIGLVIASSLYVWNSQNFTKNQKIILLIFIVFPPLQWISILLVLVYNNFINQNKPETKLNSAKENLTELKNKGLLTIDEYNSKVEKIEIQRNDYDIKNSIEYKQLKSLFDSGILSHDEFNSKIQLLKNTKSIPTTVEINRESDKFIDSELIKNNNRITSYTDNKKSSFFINPIFWIGSIIILIVIVIINSNNYNYNDHLTEGEEFIDTSAVTIDTSAVVINTSPNYINADTLTIPIQEEIDTAATPPTKTENIDPSTNLNRNYFFGNWRDNDSEFTFYSNGDYYIKWNNGIEKWFKWKYIDNKLYLYFEDLQISMDILYSNYNSFSYSERGIKKVWTAYRRHN